MKRLFKSKLKNVIFASKKSRYVSLGVLSSLVTMTFFRGCATPDSKAKHPNIVFIMMDDLGYGDVGCYGNSYNQTPNIDRLAANGLKFTDFHSNGSVCSPTRAAFMTGMYQNRLGTDFESVLGGIKQHDMGMPLEVVTIAEMLKGAGYTTGMYGKWHLGFLPPFMPSNQGFDDFRGLGSGEGDHFTHVDRSGRADWWHNDTLTFEDGYSADLITNHSVQFIREHKDVPFSLYIAHQAIHFPWQGPDDSPYRKEGTSYEDNKWGIIPDKNDVRPHVKAMIEFVDRGIGEIIQTIKDLNLEKNTLVFFTSDNGGYINYANELHNISSNGPLRGQKGEIYEGGHRVPGIAYWPGKIKAGTKTDETVLTMDMYPTFASLAGAKIDGTNPVDGVNILPLLLHSQRLQHRIVFWKKGNDRAIRNGPWKLIVRGENGPELYNLQEDIGEKNDLSKIHPELVSEMAEKFDVWHTDITEYASRWGQMH